jgi:hypothetical protein
LPTVAGLYVLAGELDYLAALLISLNECVCCTRSVGNQGQSIEMMPKSHLHIRLEKLYPVASQKSACDSTKQNKSVEVP